MESKWYLRIWIWFLSITHEWFQVISFQKQWFSKSTQPKWYKCRGLAYSIYFLLFSVCSTYIHTHHTRIYIYDYICSHICVCVNVCIYIYIHLYSYVICIHLETRMHPSIPTYLFAYIHTNMHKHPRTYMRTCIHPFILTHISIQVYTCTYILHFTYR